MVLQNRQLIIDPELKSLIPPLSEEEYTQLKESIRQYGFRSERGLIITWNNIIIDGHNRYKICLELEEETGEVFLDIDMHTREMDNLATREDVIIWMLRNQLGRRNLTDAARISVALKVESMLREKAKANLVTSTGGNNPRPLLNSTKAGGSPLNTRREIARLVKKSEDTVRKVKHLKENAPPELFEEVLTGRKSIHAGYMEMRGKRDVASNISSNESESVNRPYESDSAIAIDVNFSDNTILVKFEKTLNIFNENIISFIDIINKTSLSDTEQEKIIPLIQSTKDSLDKLKNAIV